MHETLSVLAADLSADVQIQLWKCVLFWGEEEFVTKLCVWYSVLEVHNFEYYWYIIVMLKYEMDSAYPCRSVPCQIATGILFLEWGTEENNETHLSSGSRNSIRSCSEKKSGVIAWDNLLCSFFIVYALIFSSSHSGASFLLCLCPFSFAPLIFKCFFSLPPLPVTIFSSTPLRTKK